MYNRVEDQDYQGYGFDQTYFWSNSFQQYGATFDAWPNKSLSFYKWNPKSGNKYEIGETETVWTIDNVDWYNNKETSIKLGTVETEGSA